MRSYKKIGLKYKEIKLWYKIIIPIVHTFWYISLLYYSPKHLENSRKKVHFGLTWRPTYERRTFLLQQSVGVSHNHLLYYFSWLTLPWWKFNACTSEFFCSWCDHRFIACDWLLICAIFDCTVTDTHPWCTSNIGPTLLHKKVYSKLRLCFFQKKENGSHVW